MYNAYQLFISAGLYNPAHDLAVLELAPDAIIRKDLELLKELFSKFVGRPVDGWHIRGQVCTPKINPALLQILNFHVRLSWTTYTS